MLFFEKVVLTKVTFIIEDCGNYLFNIDFRDPVIGEATFTKLPVTQEVATNMLNAFRQNPLATNLLDYLIENILHPNNCVLLLPPVYSSS